MYEIQVIEANGKEVKTIYKSTLIEDKAFAFHHAKSMHTEYANAGRARITVIAEEEEDTYIRACLIDDQSMIDDIDAATEAFEGWVEKYGAPL